MLVATLISELTIDTPLVDSFLDPSSKVTQNGMNEHIVLDDEISEDASIVVEISGGEGHVDFTALETAKLGTKDGTDLKVKGIKIRARATNDDPIVLAKGASNGHALFGDFSGLTFDSGQSMLFNFNGKGDEIGSGSRLLDMTGTNGDILEVSAVMG